jgi:hypothetical protein
LGVDVLETLAQIRLRRSPERASSSLFPRGEKSSCSFNPNCGVAVKEPKPTVKEQSVAHEIFQDIMLMFLSPDDIESLVNNAPKADHDRFRIKAVVGFIRVDRRQEAIQMAEKIQHDRLRMAWRIYACLKNTDPSYL